MLLLEFTVWPHEQTGYSTMWYLETMARGAGVPRAWTAGKETAGAEFSRTPESLRGEQYGEGVFPGGAAAGAETEVRGLRCVWGPRHSLVWPGQKKTHTE